MKIAIKQLHHEIDSNYIGCIHELIEEHNPYTFLNIEQRDENHIKKWIKEHSHHSFPIEERVFYYWITYGQEVIGIASIKKTLSKELFADSGHIGICLCPAYRQKGLGYIAMQLLMEEIRTCFGVKDILLVCEYDNIASRRLCESVGGIKKDEDSYVHYWIKE